MSDYRRRRSSNSTRRSSSGGVGILGVLQIVFIVLKLTDLIDWRWSVVLIPLWIELGLIGLILLILFLAWLLSDAL